MSEDNVAAEIFRFDREGDHDGLARYLIDLKYRRLDIVHALVTLGTNGRFRSAHLLAKKLMSAGDANPGVHLAWCVGNAIYDGAADQSADTQSLIQSVERLNADQLKVFQDAILRPMLEHALAPEIVGQSPGLEVRLRRIREAAAPRPRGPIAFTPDAGDLPEHPNAPVARPFWRTNTMLESLLFVRRNPDAPPQARLLFPPETILRLTGATRFVTYETGRDYLIDRESGLLTLPVGSTIPFKTSEELSALTGFKGPRLPDDPSALHRQQIEVIYQCAPGQWAGYAPDFAGAHLPKTLETLRAGRPLKILLMGDSISEGYGASKFMQVPPHLPSFGERVARGLVQTYRCSVTLDNVAHASWAAHLGAQQVVREGLAARHPDLVIVAFGMNDVGMAQLPEKAGLKSADYGKCTRIIVDSIRRESPDAEFILVSTMPGNPESDSYPADQFPLYRDELTKLLGPGIALADLTAVWTELLKRKSFFDAADGLNHPNDFGHRLYAQTILGLLVEPTS